MSNLILRPASFSELSTFATMAAKSKMVPPSFHNKPEDIMLAVQMGSELGLAPMQALQNIACINGRPAVWGDAAIGICRAAAVCEDIREYTEGDGDNLTAFCMAKRRGASPVLARFSVADAKRANLWGKAGPWQQYPVRMLQMRARGFALRDAFPDVLKGIVTAEEAQDTPPAGETFAGPTIEARAEPVATPEPTQDRVKDGADALAARFAAVITAQEYYAILDDEKTAKQMVWLKANRPELFAAVDAARVAAADRMQDTPAPEGEPVYDLESAQ